MSKMRNRTCITWEFRNRMAPSEAKYAPLRDCEGGVIVKAKASYFLGVAKLRIWFAHASARAAKNAQYRWAHGNKCELAWKMGLPVVREEKSYPGTFRNASVLAVDFTIPINQASQFVNSAVEGFHRFCRIEVDPRWFDRYSLPTPSVVRETMVEDFNSHTGWRTLGEYIEARFDPGGLTAFP